MNVIEAVVALAVLLLLPCTRLVNATALERGSLAFWDEANFSGIVHGVKIRATQRCYNLNCYNDRAGSVKWRALPTTEDFKGKARIAFYKNAGCMGISKDWPTDLQTNQTFPTDFDFYDLYHEVSSVMIWVTSKVADKVEDAVCTFAKVSAHDGRNAPDKSRRSMCCSVYFYENINFRGSLYPLDISDAQKCFQIDCFDKVSSVKWVGLPTAGQINGESHIAFYTDKNCVGPHIHLPTDAYINSKRDNFPVDLRQYAMNDKILSFMIWESSEAVMHGITSTCK